MLDPAVHAAPSLPRPIHGIGRLAMHALAGAGLSWRAVARNEPIAHELDRLAGRYGLATDGRAMVLSLSVADIADDVGWADALAAAVTDLPCDCGPQRLLGGRRPGAGRRVPTWWTRPRSRCACWLRPGVEGPRVSELDGPDLVVAGAGGGLVAALRGAQLGLDVLVLERQEHFAAGNNTAMSTAMVPGAGSRWQREQDVDDSPERFLDDIRAKTGGDFDERIARALVDVSARLVEWLADDQASTCRWSPTSAIPGTRRRAATRCRAGRGGACSTTWSAACAARSAST